MVNRQGLAVGLAVGVPSFIILLIVFGFWYRNQRKLRKEDLDDYIDKEIQNDDSSFQQFQEQLHKPQCDKKEKLDDGIQLKEHVVALNGTSDSSNGSLESVLHEPHHSQHSQHSQHLQHPQHPQHPQPVVAKPLKHPYGQHLQYTPSSIQPQEEQGSQSSSISLSQVLDVISNTYDQSHDELQQHSPQKYTMVAVDLHLPLHQNANHQTRHLCIPFMTHSSLLSVHKNHLHNNNNNSN